MGLKIKEAKLLAPIHTAKSGNIKVELSCFQTAVNKAVEMELTTIEGATVVALTVQDKKETILVPFTFFSHAVPFSSEELAFLEKEKKKK